MKKALKNNSIGLLIGLLCAGAYILVMSRCFDFVYAANDDVLLKSIVSGTFTGTPDGHLIYIMYPMGALLAFLYKLNNNVAWFDIMLTFFRFISYALIIAKTANMWDKLKGKIVAGAGVFALIVLADMSNTVMVQYSVVSALLAATGLFYLALFSYDFHSQRFLYIANVVIIVASLTCSMLLRKEVMALSIPAALLIITIKFIEKSKDKKEDVKNNKSLRPYLISVLTGLVVLAVCLIINVAAYSSKEWKEFKEYNSYRTDIFDYYTLDDVNYHVNDLEAAGVKAGDVWALQRYNIALMDDLNLDNIKTLRDIAYNDYVARRHTYNVPKETVYSMAKEFIQPSAYPVSLFLLITVILSLVLLSYHRKKSGFITIILLSVYTLAVMGYFLYIGRWPQRVSFGLYFMIMMTMIGIVIRYIPKSTGSKNDRIYNYSIIGIGVVAALLTSAFVYRDTVVERKIIADDILKWQTVNDYCTLNDNNIYYVETISIRTYKENVYSPKVMEADNVVRLGVWTYGGPLYDGYIKKRGLNNVYSDITRENVYVITEDILSPDCIKGVYPDNDVEVVDNIQMPDGTIWQVLSVR